MLGETKNPGTSCGTIHKIALESISNSFLKNNAVLLQSGIISLGSAILFGLIVGTISKALASLCDLPTSLKAAAAAFAKQIDIFEKKYYQILLLMFHKFEEIAYCVLI